MPVRRAFTIVVIICFSMLLGAMPLTLRALEALATPRVGLIVAAAAPTCPDAATLTARAVLHLGHDPFIHAHHSPHIHITFSATPAGFRAELRLVGTPAFRGQRAFEARVTDCADLREPVALMLAMAIEDALARDALGPARRAPTDAPPAARAAAEATPARPCPKQPRMAPCRRAVQCRASLRSPGPRRWRWCRTQPCPPWPWPRTESPRLAHPPSGP